MQNQFLPAYQTQNINWIFDVEKPNGIAHTIKVPSCSPEFGGLGHELNGHRRACPCYGHGHSQGNGKSEKRGRDTKIFELRGMDMARVKRRRADNLVCVRLTLFQGNTLPIWKAHMKVI